MATIFAWTGALRKRGELDGIGALVKFADELEAASIRTIEEGTMTKDLALLSDAENKKTVNTGEFIDEVAGRIKVVW
jgi:isocitrate dehydrogenase